MRILVTGHQGMLGTQVCREVMERGHTLQLLPTIGWENRSQRIERVTPEQLGTSQVVINCAGIVSQRQLPATDLIQSNAYGPHWLAQACEVAGIRLIQVSTDCVFHRPGPHTEFSPISPINLYALSKAAGEVTTAPHLTMRVSFIGLGPYGLVHDLQTLEEITASRRLLWSGHTAPVVAKYLVALAARPSIFGLLHMPGEWQNRYELCERLKAHFNLPVKIVEDNSFAADRQLLSTRWSKLDLPPLSTFQEELAWL